MKKIYLVLIAGLMTFSLQANAAGGHGAAVDQVHVNMSDKASLQRGAALFCELLLVLS